MLAGELPQEIHTKAEGVLAMHNTHRVLILPVVGKPELGNVGGVAKRTHSTAEAALVRQVEVESIGRNALKIKADASVIKTELVRPGGINYIRIREQAAHRGPGKVIVKSGKIVEAVRALTGFVIEPAEAHGLLV